MNDTSAPSQTVAMTVDQAFQQAIAHHQAGRLQEAQRLYGAILQAQPQHAGANHNLGVLAVGVNQPAAGLHYLKAALEADRNQGQYWLSYIDVLAKLGRIDEARQLLVQGRDLGLRGDAFNALAGRLAALGDVKDSAPAGVELAVLHREAGRYKASVHVLQEWLDSHPQDAGALALLAYALSLDKQDGPAWVALEAALAVDSALPMVRLSHARLLLKRQKVDEALKVALAAYQSDTNDAETQMVLAAALVAANQGHQARPLLDGALQSRPNYAEALANRAVLKMQGGDSSGALEDAERAVSIKPHLTSLWGLVGVLRHQFKNLPGAIEALEKAVEAEPDGVGYLINLGEFRRQAGRLESAVALLQRAAALESGNAGVWTNLGASLQQLGRKDDAKAAYMKALAISPKQAEVASNLGAMAKDEGNLEEALHYFEQALRYQPTNAIMMANRLAVLNALARYERAEVIARQVTEADPATMAGYLALASALMGQGRYEEAEITLDQLPKPASMEVEDLQRLAFTYGNLYRSQQRWRDAEMWMRRLLAAKPNDGQTLNALATCLLSQGHSSDALSAILQSLSHGESDEAKKLFIDCLKTLQPFQVQASMRPFLTRALVQPWELPGSCVMASISLLKTAPGVGECLARAVRAWPARLVAQDLFGGNGLAALAADPLLRALLVSTPINNIEMERFLTMARHAMLDAVVGEGPAPSVDSTEALSFWCALARQCFINEYVFSHTDAEIRAANGARDSLVAALKSGERIPALLPVAVAAYFPLARIPLAERLLANSWPEDLMAVLVQQVSEPSAERQLRDSIPCLTPIDDGVSLLVQTQYEENPYPRWVKMASLGKRAVVGAALQRMFPLAKFQQSEMFNNPDILIAGCGTGHHSILVAQRFQAARLLAVDLSMASLCYAKRKTQEMGLSNIDYAQADLLRLGALDRHFDVIESAGVLHHLLDPWLGWRILLSVLRPGGVMRLGFYSETARRDVVRVRNHIAQQAYPATPDGVRKCRQDLIELDKSDRFGNVIATPDFYSTSACRDLLFNVQEHRMTLDGIDAFLRAHDLRFLGFEISPQVIGAYKQRFPDDPAATHLGQWQAYEDDNPDTFFGMYQFWVQKNH
jgi:tetratricopeptide (TPR) repeat protein/SAM-dependent methyltransferase